MKNPRICRLLPLWAEVFEDLDAEPVFCFADRSPLEVAQSFRSQHGLSIEHGLHYDIANHLDAERATRGQRRAFMSYETLLTDWRGAMAGVAAALGVELPALAANEADVDAFLEPRLRHHQAAAAPLAATGLHDLAMEVHAAFARLSVSPGDRRAIETLDQLHGSLAAQRDASRRV